MADLTALRIMPPWLAYDEMNECLTIDGFLFSRGLFSQFTTSPIGVRFRVVSRENGCITVGTERDPLEAAAPEMLAALKQIADNPCLDPEGNAEIARRAIEKIKGSAS